MNTSSPQAFPLIFLSLLFCLAPAAGQAAEVEWTNVVNATAEGNSLVKTAGCNGCEDAGATSRQQLGSGNAYVEFTVPDVSQALLAGISNSNAGTSVAEIDFAVQIQNGVAEVRENGVYKAETPAANGDLFRISVEDGVVSYFRNNAAFHTSDQPPQYPLMMDVSLLSENARIDNAVAVAFGSGQDVAGVQAQPSASGQTVDLQWTQVVNAQVIDGALVKTSGCNGCEDAGARSQQALDAGNVYVEFTIPDVSKLLWVGLTNEGEARADENLDFAIRTQAGMAEVRENGVYQASIEAANGDLFRISVENGAVSYYRNGQHFHTSGKPVEYPLFLGATLADEGASVANAIAVPFSANEGIALQ